jgi:hypothetical protein
MLITKTDITQLEGFLKTETSKAFTQHALTNKLTKTLRFESEASETEAVLKMYGQNYGIFLDRGVKAQDIPFNRGSGAGSSKYIEGLTKYANLRLGLSGKAALSFAFAVATKQKKVGMPIKTKGAGTAWFSDMVKNLQLGNRVEKIVKDKVKIRIRNQTKIK